MVYVFGLTLALLIYEIGFQGWFFTIVYLPMMVSGLAMGYMATMLFATSTGTINLMLAEWFQRAKPDRHPASDRHGHHLAGHDRLAVRRLQRRHLPGRTARDSHRHDRGGDGGRRLVLAAAALCLLPADDPLVHHCHHLLPDRFVRRLRRTDSARRTEQQQRGAFAVGAVLHLRLCLAAPGAGVDADPADVLAAGRRLRCCCSGCSGGCSTKRCHDGGNQHDNHPDTGRSQAKEQLATHAASAGFALPPTPS